MCISRTPPILVPPSCRLNVPDRPRQVGDTRPGAMPAGFRFRQLRRSAEAVIPVVCLVPSPSPVSGLYRVARPSACSPTSCSADSQLIAKLPPNYRRSTAELPPFDLRITAVRPPNYRRSNDELPPFDRRITAVLPPNYRRPTAELPPFDRRITAVRPPHYRRSTAELPQFDPRITAVRPPNCSRSTAVYRRFTAILATLRAYESRPDSVITCSIIKVIKK